MKERLPCKRAAKLLCFAAACLALVFLLVAVVLPEHRLNKAERLIASGDHGAAYDLLAGKSYRNSAAIAETCLFPAQKARLASVSVGTTIRFGSYEQDNELSNGAEEIEWIVLAVDGDKALLISKYALEAREFHDERNMYAEVTWARSQLRAWLNDAFYHSAFSADHRAMILTSSITADKNPVSDVDPGRDTKDKLFLLSIDEACRYFDSDSARQCWATSSCHTRKMEHGDNGACYWWLRSPGVQPSCPAVVTADGIVFLNGFSCGHKPEVAVRPAMWIELGGS